MTRGEQEELTLLEASMEVDPNNQRYTFKYPMIKDLERFTNNRQQAISIAKTLETKLKKKIRD